MLGSRRVLGAGRGAGNRGDLASSLASEAGLINRVPGYEQSYGAAAQWVPVSLAPGGGPTYDLDWRVQKPPALVATPVSHVAETRHSHTVTVTALDEAEQPRNGVALRWSISGANPTTEERTWSRPAWARPRSSGPAGTSAGTP